jgi:mannose/cellobiose epimerase-like protein (N-acyl-D-glucosamine 2-epimerase family)
VLDREAPDRDAHCAALVAFARGARHPEGGFGWLDDVGRLDPARPVELWITCRMTHVFGLAGMLGDAAAPALLDHGVAALRGRLRDAEHGGWFAAVDRTGPVDPTKAAYAHAFVLLAAATATAAGHPDGEALLGEAIAVFERRFWQADDGMAVDVWNRDWTELEPYRGANANMHTVEALLAVHDITGDETYLRRAAGIVERIVHGVAREYRWLLPEHFDESWAVRPDYHRELPADPFRPFGATIGHLLEWARLALHVRTALGAAAPGWLLDDARALFDVAVRTGWAVDGHDGFVYTTDFDGRRVVHDRLHWVVAEALAAAYTLATVTGEPGYTEWHDRLWAHAEAYFIDREHGSWRHELDRQNRPSALVWQGKPDVYHAYQATLLPTLGEITSFAEAVRRRTSRAS